MSVRFFIFPLLSIFFPCTESELPLNVGVGLFFLTVFFLILWCHLFIYLFLLEYSCFTMLCQFLLYSKVSQLYVYIFPLFFRFPSHLGHHRSLSRVPCAIQQVLISCLFYTQQCIYGHEVLRGTVQPSPYVFTLDWMLTEIWVQGKLYQYFVDGTATFFVCPQAKL